MSLDASLRPFSEFEFGQSRQEPCRGPTFPVGALGEVGPQGGDRWQPQLVQQQGQPGGIDLDRVADAVVHAATPIEGSNAS